MFALSDKDLKRSFLGCGDGPAAFNRELSRRGGSVVSCDPIYSFTESQLRSRIAETRHQVMRQLRNNLDNYVWNTIPSPEALETIRMDAMNDFLEDFDAGLSQKRYIPAVLPALPFNDRQFDIALSSHFLFLYSGQLSLEFHIQSIEEMLRCANEARIFPMVALDGSPVPYLPEVLARLEKSRFEVEIKQVDYEFQRGANQMLLIRK